MAMELLCLVEKGERSTASCWGGGRMELVGREGKELKGYNVRVAAAAHLQPVQWLSTMAVGRRHRRRPPSQERRRRRLEL
jgi:hypothetical protein